MDQFSDIELQSHYRVARFMDCGAPQHGFWDRDKRRNLRQEIIGTDLSPGAPRAAAGGQADPKAAAYSKWKIAADWFLALPARHPTKLFLNGKQCRTSDTVLGFAHCTISVFFWHDFC
ncbi:hypothetical protein [Mesorhizobium sp.]|uniref:hypothetical protein n=1 Tax=Mesorhizobium sp. TaxID=1871066 RepID=UPI0025DF0F95|nr:hypothetical protein [Mesorhizobium sp.]